MKDANSKCCNATTHTKCSWEGTCHYVCDKCNEACDLNVYPWDKLTDPDHLSKVAQKANEEQRKVMNKEVKIEFAKKDGKAVFIDGFETKDQPEEWEEGFDTEFPEVLKFLPDNEDHQYKFLFQKQNKELKRFISQEIQSAYDRGAEEATMVCNTKTIPEAVERVKREFLGSDEGQVYQDYKSMQAQAREDVLLEIEKTLGYCGTWNMTDIISCRKKDGRETSMRVDVFLKGLK